MPLRPKDDYRPLLPFRNPHFNTVFPALFRQIVRPPFLRKRIPTPDSDFLDLDWLNGGHSRLAILCHGLEGSSDSQYIRGTAKLLHENKWDVVAVNYRSCSGEMNRQLQMYHSGATADLDTIIGKVADDYRSLVLVGFSLGGNLVLKYANDRVFPLDSKIKAVVAVSVPVDLAGGAVELLKPENRFYQWRFLKSLRKKALAKHRQFPDEVPIGDLDKVKNLRDFDEYFTGPLHGFKDAADYYDRCSSRPFLQDVRLPTLIINALDDPFLSSTCFPVKEARSEAHLHLLMPRYGGHVGFSRPGSTYYWEEPKIHDFVDDWCPLV